MAVIMANPDGSSNARVGDIVVTGGGVFEKTATGGKLVSDLKNFLGKATTNNYSEVAAAYQSYSSAVSAGVASGGNAAAQRAAETAAVKNTLAAAEDQNGIAVTGISGYDPGNYAATGSTTASTTGSNIVGYVILFLVGVAALDRFMNKGAK